LGGENFREGIAGPSDAQQKILTPFSESSSNAKTKKKGITRGKGDTVDLSRQGGGERGCRREKPGRGVETLSSTK